MGSLVVDLVPLEEPHRCQMEEFQDRLDAGTVYLRHGACFSAGIRKSTAWLERQWNKEGHYVFSQGAFLHSSLIGIGSIYKAPGGKSAEVALVVAPEFQGLGRGGAKGVADSFWKTWSGTHGNNNWSRSRPILPFAILAAKGCSVNMDSIFRLGLI